MPDGAEAGCLAPRALLPLLRELADLKRVRSADQPGSLAERLFARAWTALAGGTEPDAVAGAILGDALAATRLSAIDTDTLGRCGVPHAEALRIRQKAIADVAGALDTQLHTLLSAETTMAAGHPPGFVHRLARQPRAGATAPGKGRLAFDPTESHADHCAIVAVAGIILAPSWGADPITVFLAGLAHHLHNALLPDSGFAGEVMLGDWLDTIVHQATSLALDELPDLPREWVTAACRILPEPFGPEGQAFTAADTIDRVLQVEYHLRAAQFTMDYALRDMELVHAGPAKPFQDSVLRAMGLGI